MEVALVHFAMEAARQIDHASKLLQDGFLLRLSQALVKRKPERCSAREAGEQMVLDQQQRECVMSDH